MAFSRAPSVPRVPTLPKGEEIAAYPTYLEAQRAVDRLSEQRFPVEQLTIVGTDLRMVERVTGRLSYGRVATAGAMSGAWFGLFVGLLLSLFGGAGVATGVPFVGIGLGAGFGLLFSVLSYALTRSRRDFTSQSQVVAHNYAVWCAPESAGRARAMLAGAPSSEEPARLGANPVSSVSTASAAGVQGVQAVGSASALGEPATAEPGGVLAAGAVSAPDSRWVLPDGTPRYGQMAPVDPPQVVAEEAHPGLSQNSAGAAGPVVVSVAAQVPAGSTAPPASDSSPGTESLGSNKSADPYATPPHD